MGTIIDHVNLYEVSQKDQISALISAAKNVRKPLLYSFGSISLSAGSHPNSESMDLAVEHPENSIKSLTVVEHVRSAAKFVIDEAFHMNVEIQPISEVDKQILIGIISDYFYSNMSKKESTTCGKYVYYNESFGDVMFKALHNNEPKNKNRALSGRYSWSPATYADIEALDHGSIKYNILKDIREDLKKELEEHAMNNNEPKIKDSGNRETFSSGAVRDRKEGNGRCDLMPLGVVSIFIHSSILKDLEEFKSSGYIYYLYEALNDAKREFRFDSNADMLIEVSKHFEAGAEKYGENNWQKGIPLWSYIDSTARHTIKYHACWKDERHDRAAVWNILCAIWTAEHIELGKTLASGKPVRYGFPKEDE